MLKNAALEECGSQIHNTCPELTRADKARCFGSIRLAATLLGVLIITNDAVDVAHSAASECHRVVALKRTTMRGAVHGRS
jgi:hypothetical protein